MGVEILQNSKKFRNSSVLYHKTKNAFKVKFCKHVSFYCYSYTSWMQKLQRVDNSLDWLLIDVIWKPSILRLHIYVVQCRHSNRDTWKKIVLWQRFLSWVISQKNRCWVLLRIRLNHMVPFLRYSSQLFWFPYFSSSTQMDSKKSWYK